MKNFAFLSILALTLFVNFNSLAQKDNDKRKSPHTTVKQTLPSGAEISFFYGQPQVKGRTIGKDLEPKENEVWRVGADEATVFETSKALKINGQNLPAGKYSFFTLTQNGEWTLIFNSKWDQWGAYDYKEKLDLLRVKVKPQKGNFTEKLTFTINEKGEISILWGDLKIGFMAQ